MSQLEKKVGSLDEELKAAKKLPGQLQIRPSTLNQEEKQLKPRGKRPGSDKRSKKTDFEVDEARLIEPEELPEGVRFNGYREYDVQDLILKRQPQIEQKLAKRHLASGTIVLCDLTSTYLEGATCSLAKRGYSRDGKRGTLQVVFALLCDANGRPIAVEVSEGNTADSTTVECQINK